MNSVLGILLDATESAARSCTNSFDVYGEDFSPCAGQKQVGGLTLLVELWIKICPDELGEDRPDVLRRLEGLCRHYAAEHARLESNVGISNTDHVLRQLHAHIDRIEGRVEPILSDVVTS